MAELSPAVKQASRRERARRATLRRQGRLSRIGWVLLQAILWLYAITVVAPMVWTILQSVRDTRSIIFQPWDWPRELQLDNYVQALTRLKVGTYLLNSAIVTFSSLALLVLLASMVAYVLARYKFPGNRLVYYYLLASMIIPGFLLAVPVWMMIRRWGLLNNYLSLILIYSSGIPWSVFILHAFFKTLPPELEDAAIIDGCSLFGVWWRVMMPLSKSGLITVALFGFLGLWNEYFWALIILWEDTKRTLPVGMAALLATQTSDLSYGPLFAGFVIMLVPTLVVYATFQGRLTQGITIGALKG